MVKAEKKVIGPPDNSFFMPADGRREIPAGEKYIRQTGNLSFVRARKGAINIGVILILIALFWGLRTYLAKMFVITHYRGEGFVIEIPQGWERKKVDQYTIMFISPEKDFLTGTPEAIISLYAKKSPGALFLDDYYIKVMEAIYRAGNRIMQRGEIKISELLAKWVLYENVDPDVVIMAFYMVDDFNRLFQIQYVSQPDKFKKHRETFEKLKNSFKHRAFGL